jgi:hypothetical protein
MFLRICSITVSLTWVHQDALELASYQKGKHESEGWEIRFELTIIRRDIVLLRIKDKVFQKKLA